MDSRSSGRNKRPLASWGQASGPAQKDSRSSERRPADPPGDTQAHACTSHQDSASTPPLVAQPHPQSHHFPTLNPLPYPWPPAPPSSSSARPPQLAAKAPTSTISSLFSHVFPTLGADQSIRPPPLMAQTPAPVIPALFPALSSHLAPGTVPSASRPPQAAPSASFPPAPSISHARSSFSLSSAKLLPMSLNAPALDPTPVSSNIRNQILSGGQGGLPEHSWHSERIILPL
ncbi:proline-rich protein 36 [Cyprinus carpio]|uniref:Proline-rich protein 36 n=1 Tax=Cyprinus carpio TaxID=7962 RepID=A0A9Q9VYG5_CYPCA|nr:proline-rich protein 36 [Cyprinus carpio]